MEISIISKNPPLDFELCELLGEKPGDFINICADGKQVPFFGTPYDSPEARKQWLDIVASLNVKGSKSRWKEVFDARFVEFVHYYKLPVTTNYKDFHPVFTLEISRVCAGYSEHVHVAIGLFEALGDRVRSWSVSKTEDGRECAEITSATGKYYNESGKGMARLIARAAVRLLRDMPAAAVPPPTH